MEGNVGTDLPDAAVHAPHRPPPPGKRSSDQQAHNAVRRPLLWAASSTWTKGHGELPTSVTATRWYFLVTLVSKNFPYFPAMSACYRSLRKLIKMWVYFKKRNWHFNTFRSASVSPTLSAPLWVWNQTLQGPVRSILSLLGASVSLPNEYFMVVFNFYFNLAWP